MDRNRPIHPAFLWAGWIGLLVGLLVPFAVSLLAIAFFRNLRCATEVIWTFAPLVLGCGPLSPLRIGAGWIGTVVTVGSLTVALGVAGISLWRALRGGHKRGHASAMSFSVTVIAVSTAIGLVFASAPDGLWGIGSWMLFSSSAGLLTCFASVSFILTSLAFRKASASRRVLTHSSPSALPQEGSRHTEAKTPPCENAGWIRRR